MKTSQTAEFLSFSFLLALASVEFSTDACLKRGRKIKDFCLKQDFLSLDGKGITLIYENVAESRIFIISIFAGADLS